MEISVWPRSFLVSPGKVPQADGSQAGVMRLTVQDVGGTVLHITFGLADWEQFQAAVADHEAAAARAAARAKIVGPGGMATVRRERKH